MKILCTYATRQIDSNLLMAGTVFGGLKKAGFSVDAVFCGPDNCYKIFCERYSKYFESIYYLSIHDEIQSKRFKKSHFLSLAWTFWIHFIKDFFVRPYSLKLIKKKFRNRKYNCILSFVPPVVSGRLGKDMTRILGIDTVLIQFWTDPLSLGACNDISKIPARRILHKITERSILSKADKNVFCFPLLCEMESKLHPRYASKMTWSDVSYVEHRLDEHKTKNKKVTIGLFGAYQSSVRNIYPFLECVKELTDYQFILRGDSDLEIDANDFSNLDVKRGRCPVDEVEVLEANCDILVSLNAHSGFMPPGKTFYYASYKKPIVFISDGPYAQSISEYMLELGRYEVCINQTESIMLALEKAVCSLESFELKIPKRMQPEEIARKIITGA